MVRDFGKIVNRWQQSTSLTWFDCPSICAIITAWQSTQSSLQDKGLCHQFYINPLKSMKKVRMHICSFSPIKIVRDILVRLKFWRAVPRLPVRTSFFAKKKSIWLEWSWMDSSRNINKRKSLSDSSVPRRTLFQLETTPTHFPCHEA